MALAGAAATLSFASPALSQPATPQTPRNWSYQVDSAGKRIDRDRRVVNADGSWREEIREGNCTTIKERSATGEYKETRRCNIARPR